MTFKWQVFPVKYEPCHCETERESHSVYAQLAIASPKKGAFWSEDPFWPQRPIATLLGSSCALSPSLRTHLSLPWAPSLSPPQDGQVRPREGQAGERAVLTLRPGPEWKEGQGPEPDGEDTAAGGGPGDKRAEVTGYEPV